VDEFVQACRRHGTRTVLFHAAVAERMGLNPSDHKCTDILMERGSMTAGQLAAVTGLTTGAITGVVDRLVRAGLVAREADPNDRRKVLLRATPERCRHFMPLFTGIQAATEALYAAYTPKELELIVEFLDRSANLLEDQVQRLRHSPAIATPRETTAKAGTGTGRLRRAK
jgi:DNA-binding MarR family transcriptional regulator